VGYRRGAYRVLLGKPEGRRSLGRHERVLLKWILKKWDRESLTGFL
jgi:hypothetical protein